LEHNNFLTTLIEINNDKNSKLDKNDKSTKNVRSNKIILKELKSKFLKEIKVINDVKYEPKFLFNYKIPGFYNFYKDLSDYLIKNITAEFMNNEKKLRDYSGDEPEIAKNKFHEKEKELLNKVLEKISEDKLYFDLINKIKPDLILKDYITFYLEKYIGTYSQGYLKLIDLLLSLRFSEKNHIIKDNEFNDKYNEINFLVLKIIWTESNYNYIESILKAFEISKDIINDKDGIGLYQIIYDSIYDTDNYIKYIVDKERNPEFRREVNECFYKLLAGLCLSITENIELMEITIKDYFDMLKEINNILQILNNDLKIYLNELFIIDELIKIIEYELDKGIKNIKNIEIIRNYLIENSKIIQKNKSDKFIKLIENFMNLNKILKEEKDEKFKNKYYEALKYVYMQEIKKINGDTYRAAIFEELMKEKDIIKKSNDILQLLLQSYLEDFLYTLVDLLDNKDKYVIILLIDKFLSDKTTDNYLALSETLIYFFEKNSLIYLKNKSLEEEPLDIFKDCNEFLFKLKKNPCGYCFKSANITKLFCIGYIKSYCFIFIKMHDQSKFKPEKIIEQINKSDKIKMVKLYIYKIIYNQYKKQINIFFNDNIKNKYKLDKYEGFEDFIKFKNEELIIYENKILDNDNYKNIYKKLDDYQKDGFKKEITKEDISSNGKYKFDDFYMAASNLILSKLKQKAFETDDIYINFYNNICEPLYKNEKEKQDSNKLLTLIQFLFEKEKYLKIKKEYEINPEDIEILLYGYRYCLNEISEEYNNRCYIYISLFDKNQLNYLDKYFYPGGDPKKEEPYYELYNKIENHFKDNPNQGCYVCLCDKGFYHSVLSGFPGYFEINIKCPNCDQDIGAKEIFLEEKDEENKIKIHKIYKAINREKYFRIFKDKEEINKLERNRGYYNKLQEINYMTKEEFKQKYIKPLYSKEKGLNEINENNFKKHNKKIRNLSQISYRLLNYILYSHLFFSKLFTDSGKLDNYLPKGMTWFSTIKECFNLLQKELEKKGIKEIKIFMNFIFKDLFNKLYDKECIKEYEDLIKFESELDKLIQEKLEQLKKEIKKFEKESINDKTSGIALLKEIYNNSDYNPRDYPYYEYFYYTDYFDEEYISNMLEHKYNNEYPVLSKYLKFKKQKKSKENKDKYSFDNLIIFIKVLNLFNDKYSNQITRELAEKTIIKDSDIYKKTENEKKKENDGEILNLKKIEFLDNKELIDEFIKIYNGLELEEENKEEKMKLDVNQNCICDFLLVDDNKYGKTYKKIYETFIEKQNKQLEDLLNAKINIGIFNNNCKNRISVQKIKENEIFTFNILKKKFNFIEVIFNSSYRKIIDTQNYENYNEYEINLNSIETKMTNLLLKNKKLLNNELIGFNYKIEKKRQEAKERIQDPKKEEEEGEEQEEEEQEQEEEEQEEKEEEEEPIRKRKIRKNSESD